MKLKKISQKFFKKTASHSAGNGLFVTVEDLVAERLLSQKWQINRLNKVTSDKSGEIKSLFKGRGMEFEEIRAYAFGDDVRDIDWRVTARKQQPYTKLYAEEKDREVYVLLDMSTTMVFGTKKELKSVTAAKITARIGWQSLQHKDRFGCLLYCQDNMVLLKAQNTQANMMLIFRKIAEVSRRILTPTANDNKNSFKKAIALLQQSIKHRAIVFVISDFSSFSEDIQQSFAQLAKKADVTFIPVYDCLEVLPPINGEYMVQQNDEQLVFSTSEKSFDKVYRRYFAHKHQEISDFCRKFKMHYLENKTEECK